MTEHVRVNGCPSDATGGFLMTWVTIGGAEIERNNQWFIYTVMHFLAHTRIQ